MEWKTLENPDNLHYDVVICTVPWTSTEIPLMAPAVLKTTAERAGKSCLAADLNIEVLNYGNQHPDKNKFVSFFFEEKLDDSVEHEVYEIFYSVAKQIASFSPNWVGLSVFSYLCQPATKWLAYFVRKLLPEAKIVIGGPGCMPTFTGNSVFIDRLREMNLVDYHIRGDGEISFYELLTGNDKYPGINDLTWKELSSEQLETLPIPDFSDYKFDLYQNKTVPVIGSRGCVRQCTFCDYITNWKQFRWRNAENVFDEIITQANKYNVTNVKFQDSLINGNQKQFNRLVALLADYNEKNPDRKISWSSFFIFREHNDRSEQEWELIAKSGARMLAVGIENFNQHIRYDLGKKFSDEAIIYHLEQALKHKIKISILHITGYINETQKDIDYIKQWLRDNVRFREVIEFYWGNGLGIFDNTYLGNNKDALGITMIGPSPHDWVSKHTDSTPEVRLKWSLEFMELSRQLGYANSDPEEDMHFLLERFLK